MRNCTKCCEPMVSIQQLAKSEPDWYCISQSCNKPNPATLNDVMEEMRAQTELLARIGQLIARSLGSDPGDVARWLSPEEARSAFGGDLAVVWVVA